MTRVESPPQSSTSGPAAKRGRGKPGRARVRSQAHPIWNYLVRRAWIHLVLLAGVALFVFPFIWMVGTSMKTDEEMADTAWFPTIPQFRPESPYVRAAPKLERAGGATEAQWEAALPKLREITQEALKKAELPAGAQRVDTQQYRQAVLQTLIDRLSAKVRYDLWRRGARSCIRRIASR